MIIQCRNVQKELPKGTTVQDCLKALDAFPIGTLAALRGGVSVELNEPVTEDCSLIPLTLEHEEGRRIYERSLRFVMLLALKHLYPYEQVRIEYSVGYGVFVRLPGRDLHRQDIVRIENDRQGGSAAAASRTLFQHVFHRRHVGIFLRHDDRVHRSGARFHAL